MLNLKYCILVGGLSSVIAGAGLSGCSSSRARESGRTPTQYADDNQISDRVISSLKTSPVYKFPNVGVRTFDRVVQLNGFVVTEEQKRAAEEIAQQAPGAVRVINDIVIQQQAPPEPTPTGRPNEPAPPPNQPNPSAPRNQSGS